MHLCSGCCCCHQQAQRHAVLWTCTQEGALTVRLLSIVGRLMQLEHEICRYRRMASMLGNHRP